MTLLVGCDFSSAPGRRKPIVVATGEAGGDEIRLRSLLHFEMLDAWRSWLSEPSDWVGGFDFPFGLPRELVEHEGWPTDWPACMRHYAAMPRDTIRRRLTAFCDGRPAGRKFAHRVTDGPAGSSPSMKWVNPPVAFMLHAGVPALLEAGVHLPGLLDGDRRRVALEAYPGLLAREILGRRSYKSDDRQRQTPERRLAREALLAALCQGRTRLGLRLCIDPAQQDALLDDARGDRLDAVLCLVQAGWAQRAFARGDARYGLPAFDPLEGWIVTAESAAR